MDVLARPAEELTHGDVTLRRWRRDDAELAFRLVSDSLDVPAAVDAAGRRYTRPAAAREFLRSCEREWQAGEAFNYLVSEHGGRAAARG